MDNPYKAILGEEQMPLQGRGFLHGPRAVRDKYWAYAFLTFVGLVVAGGVYSVASRNPLSMSMIDPEFMNDPHNCPAPQWNLSMRSRRSAEDQVDVASIATTFMGGIAIAIVCSVLTGYFTLWLARVHPRAMVYGCTWFIVLIMASLGTMLCFSAGWPGVFMVVMAALLAVLIIWGRESLEICASLMKVAGLALSHNLHLVWVSALIETVKVSLCVGVLGFAFFGLQNGHFVARAGADYDPLKRACYAVAQSGRKVPIPCCSWEPTGWAIAYIVLAFVFMLWLAMLCYQIRMFTVSGVVAHWYFTPNEQQSSSLGRVNASLKNALGPQFGSVCESSAVLTIVQMIRQEAQERHDGNDGCRMLVSSLLKCIADIIERLTNFTTVTMSITGQSFMDSATHTYDLLTRNMLSTVTVWWLPGLVIKFFVMMLSLVFAVFAGGASYSHLHRVVPSPSTEDVVLMLTIFFSIFVFIFSLSILIFFTGILLNAIDTIFICFAMDCDTRQQTRPEVHQIYTKVPGVAKAVEAGCYSAPPPPY